MCQKGSCLHRRCLLVHIVPAGNGTAFTLANRALDLHEAKGWTLDCWGGLQHRGTFLLSWERLLEEEEGENVNERFIKSLTAEIEDITCEAFRAGKEEIAAKVMEMGKGAETH